MKYIVVCMCAFIFVLSGCQNDHDNNQEPQTPHALDKD